MYESIVYDLQAELCHAMSHSARQKIIHILGGGQLSVGEISSKIEVGQSAVSRHLAILRRSGLVTTERHGQEIYYQVANPKITEVCDLMRKVLTEQNTERIKMMAEFNENNW